MALRVMWLLNHTSARKFEIPMLKRCGVSQIYLPKIIPEDISFRSGSVSYEEDSNLNIPSGDLEVLNSSNWYTGATPEAWAVANRHFDVAFIILYDERLFKEIARHFSGAILYRVYGLLQPLTYSKLINWYGLESRIRSVYPRFYFAEGYSHLADCEEQFVANRRLLLPLGMASRSVPQWQGSNKRIYFVCPNIGNSDYYKIVFEQFKRSFSEFDFVVAGEQLLPVEDPRVLGFVTDEEHKSNMSGSRVMFYHSQEPNHVHYHPFEAVLAGMPLVFMAGGMLDRLGGIDLPGRARSVHEARSLIRRVMEGDYALIERIQSSQKVLLQAMDSEMLVSTWKAGLDRIQADLSALKRAELIPSARKKVKRIAVILPEAYRGGTLRGALMLAQAIYLGSKQSGECVEVVFAYRDDTDVYEEDDFIELDEAIALRPFHWRQLSAAEAGLAMHYAGKEGWKTDIQHQIPDDGMRQFTDCDLWVFVSDRLTSPVLPLRPMVLMVYDYLQRYENVVSRSINRFFISAARSAEKVLVTTNFTRQDALQYAGLDPNKVSLVPMLIPKFAPGTQLESQVTDSYFVWTTNAAPHKNHVEILKALRIYYEELGGRLSCKVTGVGTDKLLTSKELHLKPMQPLFNKSKHLQKMIEWCGDLSDTQYKNQLQGAKFLMHGARIDNGTFSVLEAALLGVPSLSTDYPAMREIDSWFKLQLTWMDGNSARDIAQRLIYMESSYQTLREKLPKADIFSTHSVNFLAQRYWEEIRQCL